MLSSALVSFLPCFLVLIMTNLAELFNSPAKFKAIQINKTSCSVHCKLIFIHSGVIVKGDSKLYLFTMVEFYHSMENIPNY